jgi:hypothetical protein
MGFRIGVGFNLAVSDDEEGVLSVIKKLGLNPDHYKNKGALKGQVSIPCFGVACIRGVTTKLTSCLLEIKASIFGNVQHL